jgi:signal transduction histidine kinase
VNARSASAPPGFMGGQANRSVTLRRLLHEVLEQDPLSGLPALLCAVARTAGASGALLWKQSSIVARWSNEQTPTPAEYVADRLTIAALRDRRPAIPLPNNGVPVMAALPVDYPDGVGGALTLLGDAPLTIAALGPTRELLDVLPHLWDILRERQCLGLVRACNDILNQADIEASEAPLSRGRLADYLTEVCAAVAKAVPGRDASIFLRDPASADETYPLIASSAGESPAWSATAAGADAVGQTIAGGEPLVAELPGGSPAALGGLMVVPLKSGEHVWGAIACSGAPLRFTAADLALVTPIAPHVAQYWSNWLHRRTISAENESWRELAAGITDFYRLLSKELRRKTPNDGRMYRAALRMVQRVLPECTGCDVRHSAQTPSGDRLLELVCSTGASTQRSTMDARPLAAGVLRSHSQRWTTDPAEINAEGISEQARWLVCSPIRVDEEVYGVLDAFGSSSTLPPNSQQMCEIVGDQLGLYRRLKKATQELDQTVRGQAHAMEDLQHQLVSPLLVAVNRTDKMLDGKRLTGRVEVEVRSLRAVRGLCRQASRVAMSAHIFAGLSTGRAPSPRLEQLTADEVVRVLIAGADDAQLLSDSRRRIRFDVDRETVRALARQRIAADLSFFEQCLGNLLDNAAKYSYEDTCVEIRGVPDGRGFCVAVTSTGLPMTAEDAARCLEREWRGKVAASVTGEGSGLGLWIVDHLMNSVGGAVRIEPAGDRTTVLLTFPLTPA